MNHFAPIAATLLLTAFLQGALLAACVALTLRLLPALTAAARATLWIATFLLITVLPFATLHASAVTPSAILPTHLAPIYLAQEWAVALATLWAAAAAWQLTRLIRGWSQLRRLASTATPITPTPEVAALLHHSRPFSTPIQLCVSPQIQVPSVAGFFNPRILLPTSLAETVSAEDLHQIVLHEMQHLHRHDDWTNLLQKLGLAFFPLNPALWYADRRLCQERELACDDAVLRANGASSIAYATCLTNLAEQRLGKGIVSRSLALALGAFRRPSELARRIHRILTPGRATTRTGRYTATALTAAALLATAATLTHTPRFITFDTPPAAVAEAEPITHFDRTSAHAVLTKAALPINPIPRKVTLKRHRTRTRAIVMPGPQIILLGWHPNEFTAAPRPTLIDYRYAAIATPSGWLLIEI